MQEELSAVRAKDDFDIVGPLPQRNIDTGMGLERMATLLQGVDNLYEIDEVYPVLERAAELTGKRYGAQSGQSSRVAPRRRPAARRGRPRALLADAHRRRRHPGNEGRGYVLRRMLRRAVRSMRLLGYEDPCLPELFPVSVERMRQSYPELGTGFDRISQIAYAEEEAFRRTSPRDDDPRHGGRAHQGVRRGDLAGDQAFQLHDTYGFPIDLTLEMAAEQGLEVDREGFTRLMQEQRQRAKADAKSKRSGHANTEVWRDLRAAGATDFRLRGADERGHRGQASSSTASRCRRWSRGSARWSWTARRPTRSPADRSRTRASSRPTACAPSRRRPAPGQGARRSHRRGRQAAARGRAGARRGWSGVAPRRVALRHVHVVHALRQVLGPSALQSGSYNKPGYLRLDFAWGQALPAGIRSEIEEVANLAVRKTCRCPRRSGALPPAREIGALALFGTYGEDVRVVEIGGPWSRELCGGTHVQHSSQVGALTSPASRRWAPAFAAVEAFVGIDALHYLARERAIVAEPSSIVGPALTSSPSGSAPR